MSNHTDQELERLHAELKERIKKDPDFARKLAESMVLPVRCGGWNYDAEGRPIYSQTGKLVELP